MELNNTIENKLNHLTITNAIKSGVFVIQDDVDIPDNVAFPKIVSDLSNKDFLVDYAKNMPTLYEKNYSSKEYFDLFGELRICRTFIAPTHRDSLMFFCLNDLNFDGSEYIETTKLSKKGRIKLNNVADFFEGISISCVDISEIESVTLFSKICVPKDAPDEKYKVYFPCDDKRPHEAHYIPIKTISNIKTNFISFFDLPICQPLEHYTSLSIQVTFKQARPYFNLAGLDRILERYVKLHFLYIDCPLRNKIITSLTPKMI